MCLILLPFRKHLHGRIISLKGKVWAHRASLTQPHLIEIPVSSQESGRSYNLQLFLQCGIFSFSFYANRKHVIKIYEILKSMMDMIFLHQKITLNESKHVLLSFCFWPLLCLSIFYLRLLITPLVSSDYTFDIF